jgi:hypothetical protein
MNAVVRKDFLSETKRVLQEVKKTKNFEAGFQFINELDETGQILVSDYSCRRWNIGLPLPNKR